ncbi:hypothetical protein AgCh_031348 [Apium graveolens]
MGFISKALLAAKRKKEKTKEKRYQVTKRGNFASFVIMVNDHRPLEALITLNCCRLKWIPHAMFPCISRLMSDLHPVNVIAKFRHQLREERNFSKNYPEKRSELEAYAILKLYRISLASRGQLNRLILTSRTQDMAKRRFVRKSPECQCGRARRQRAGAAETLFQRGRARFLPQNPDFSRN